MIYFELNLICYYLEFASVAFFVRKPIFEQTFLVTQVQYLHVHPITNLARILIVLLFVQSQNGLLTEQR